MIDQLEDYVIPRQMSVEAPLLAVVGGSTGAGKSTLVNSLVGRRVTTSGLLRPTTRSPVLVHHPDDAEWFGQDRLLPDLVRVDHSTDDPDSLQLVASDTCPSAWRSWTRPDVDSVEERNRDPRCPAAGRGGPVALRHLGRPLRRPGAVGPPQERRRALGLRRDRARPDAGRRRADRGRAPGPDAREPWAQGLAALHGQRVRRSPRRACSRPPRSPTSAGWLVSLAEDSEARGEVVKQTLDGTIRTLARRTHVVADAAAEQLVAIEALREAAGTAYDEDTAALLSDTGDGTLLHGEILARWQEFVGTGELLRGRSSRRSGGCASGWSTP